MSECEKEIEGERERECDVCDLRKEGKGEEDLIE